MMVDALYGHPERSNLGRNWGGTEQPRNFHPTAI